MVRRACAGKALYQVIIADGDKAAALRSAIEASDVSYHLRPGWGVYHTAILQLANLWTEGVEPGEYVVLLMESLEKLNKLRLGKGLLPLGEYGPKGFSRQGKDLAQVKESGPTRLGLRRNPLYIPRLFTASLPHGTPRLVADKSARVPASSCSPRLRPRRHSIESFLPPAARTLLLPPSFIQPGSLPVTPPIDAQVNLRIRPHTAELERPNMSPPVKALSGPMLGPLEGYSAAVCLMR